MCDNYGHWCICAGIQTHIYIAYVRNANTSVRKLIYCISYKLTHRYTVWTPIDIINEWWQGEQMKMSNMHEMEWIILGHVLRSLIMYSIWPQLDTITKQFSDWKTKRRTTIQARFQAIDFMRLLLPTICE